MPEIKKKTALACFCIATGLFFLCISILFAEHPLFTGRDPVPLRCCYPWFEGEKKEIVLPHDNILDHFPYWSFQLEGLRKGQLRFWNPFVFGGMPMWVNIPPLFSPFNLWGVIFPDKLGFILINFSWLFFTGIGFYVLSRAFGFSRFISFLTAYFVLAGVRWYAYHDYVPSVALFPYLVLFITRFFSCAEKRWLYFFLSLLFHGFLFLVTNPLMAVYVSVFLHLYWIYGYIANHEQTGIRPFRFILLLLVFCFAGIGAGASHIFPTLDFILEGHRVNEQVFKVPWSWLPLSLVQVFFPRALSQQVEIELWRRTYADLIRENTGLNVTYEGFYLGVIPLAAILFSFLKKPRFFWSFTFFKLWAAAVFAYLSFSSVPFLSSSRLYSNAFSNALVPSRLLSLPLICFAFLAVSGLENMMTEKEEENRRLRRVLLSLGGFVFLLWLGCYFIFLKSSPAFYKFLEHWADVKSASGQDVSRDYYMRIADGIAENVKETLRFHLYFPVLLLLFALLLKSRGKRTVFYGGLLALLFFDNFIVAGTLGRMSYPFSFHYPETPAVRFLKTRCAGGKVAFIKKENKGKGVVPGDSDNPYISVFPANTFMHFRIKSANGYHAMILKRYFDLMKASGADANTHRVHFFKPDNPVFSLCGVRCLVTAPGRQAMPEHYELIYDGEVSVYKNKNAFPEAYVVHAVHRVSNEDDALEWLVNKNFDTGQKQAVIEAKDGGAFLFKDTGGGMDTVSAREDVSFQEMRIQANLSSDGVLIVNIPYSKGWQAYVDGKKSRIYPANAAFQGISLVKGKHDVRLVYHPLSFYAGMAVSLVCLSGILAGLIVSYKKAGT